MKKLKVLTLFLLLLVSCSNFLQDSSSSIYYIGNGADNGEVPIDNTEYISGDVISVKGNISNLTRVGYIFKCWNTNDDGSGLDYYANSEITIYKSDIILYAIWEILPVYSVTFQSNTTDIIISISAQSVIEGGLITRPVDPTITGYTFVNWYADFELTNIWNFQSDTVQGDMTLYAAWEISHTVSFETYSESTITNQIVVDNGLIAEPEEPIKEGYMFIGWYLDSSQTILWDFETETVNNNITLHAGWNALPIYSITFESITDELIFTISGQTVYENNLISQPEDPIMTGYLFDGWYSDPALTIPWNFEIDTVNTNVTLYAAWIPIYTVSFSSNLGSDINNQKITEGDLVIRPNDPIRPGYILSFWYSDPDLTIIWDFDNNTITEDTILYAGWYPVYTITFDSNSDILIDSQIVVEGEYVTEPISLEKTHYVFTGWYSDSDLINIWNFDITPVTSDITLYAGWEILPTYTVSFESFSESYISSQILYADELVVKPVNPSKDHYIFINWYTDETLTTVWDFDNDLLTSDIVLYAGWEAITYTIIFESNSGSYIDNITVQEGSYAELPTPPSREGFIFNGWYSNSELTTEWDFETMAIWGDTILYAGWTPKIKSVYAGSTHTMILKTDNSLWATGQNEFGQIGDGSTTNKHTPVYIMGNVESVAVGKWHTMILKTDGTLWATGYNSYGQLGDRTTIHKSTPIEIMGDVSRVAAGDSYTMILKSDGSLWATGLNTLGVFGNGTNESSLYPIEIMTGVSEVYTGYLHTFIIKNDNTLWATGRNTYGELGDNTTINKSTFVQVMENIIDLSAGKYFTMVIKTDYSLWGTGNNDFGQLGDNTEENKSSFTQIMLDVRQVSSGYHHTMILKSDGSLWGTGSNSYGELGDGTQTSKKAQ